MVTDSVSDLQNLYNLKGNSVKVMASDFVKKFPGAFIDLNFFCANPFDLSVLFALKRRLSDLFFNNFP